MPGCLVFSEIHENSGAKDPAEEDADERIEPGVAHQPHGGAGPVAVTVKQLKDFHQPAARFSGAQHREEVVRENPDAGLERFGNCHALITPVQSHANNLLKRLGTRSCPAQLQRPLRRQPCCQAGGH